LNRSAFAAGLLRAMQDWYGTKLPKFLPAYEITSSGLIGDSRSRSPMHMQSVARDYGVELKKHTPSRFKPAGKADLRIAMGADIWDDLPHGLHWKVSDPMGGPPKAYERMAMQVQAHLKQLLARTAHVRPDDASLEAAAEK